MFTTNIHLLQFKIYEVTCKNADFECQYIRTHTKEIPSKMSNITFAILPSYHKKKKKKKKKKKRISNQMASLSTVKSTTFDEHQMRFKMLHFNTKTQNLKLVNFKCV